MIVQIQNVTKTNFNQIQSTPNNMFKDIRLNGWKVGDCKVIELQDELVNKVYRGVDGKNIPAGRKQYKSRAISRGTIVKTNATVAMVS